MRHLALFSCITLALLAPVSAMAEDSAQLKVTGTISPASCSVAVAGGSDVMLDPVKLGDFTAGQDLPLKEKTASLTVSCEGAAAKFRLKASDSSDSLASVVAPDHYGLGWNGEGSGGDIKPNGYFKLSIDTGSMQSNKFVLKSTDGGLGEEWAQTRPGQVPFDHDGEAFAFAAKASDIEPADLTTLTVPLKINAVLAKDPTVTEEVLLAGQATIEILY
jgi:type 1 fimbria pilin